MIGSHTAIPVRNVEVSIAFYQKLGFSVDEKWERSDWQMSGQILKHPTGFTLELITHPDNNKITYPKYPEVLHLAFPVADLDEVLSVVVPLGAKIVRNITPGIKVKRLAFIQDPNGFAIELFEPKA